MTSNPSQDNAEPASVAPSADQHPAESNSDTGSGQDCVASFADLGLNPSLVQRLADGGYKAPTPIQEQAIPPLLKGRDVVGQAQTGTGKTAAFSLPMIQSLDLERREVQGLVLCPTRELAMQVSDALSSYGESNRVRVLTVYGGTPIQKQLTKLRGGVHIVVGTPGRIKDCIARRALNLDTVRHVVLDEADEMLRMGFIDDVEEILGKVPKERQTALFSATMPPAIQRVAASYLRDPVQVAITKRTRTVERIEQRVLLTHSSEKLNVLARLIEAEPTDAVLVFARTRASCAHLVEQLKTRGVAGAALHGDLSQDQREEIVSQLRSRRIQLVVATDIAARGLDVEGITHVINYDPPSEPEIYVHRIGRTGRAGRDGISILLVTPKQQRVQFAIEHYTGQRMSSMKVPTNAELMAGRTARFKAQVLESIEKGGLDPYLAIIEDMSAEPNADVRVIAAALARMSSRERPLEINEPEPSMARGGGSQRGGGPSHRGAGSNSVQLFVALGRQAGIRPADLVGAIANEANIPGSAVGAIDIRDKVSFIEVPTEHAKAITEKMSRVTIRGQVASFVTARPGSFDRGGRKPAPRRFDKPFKRSGGPRKQAQSNGAKPWEKKFERKQS